MTGQLSRSRADLAAVPGARHDRPVEFEPLGPEPPTRGGDRGIAQCLTGDRADHRLAGGGRLDRGRAAGQLQQVTAKRAGIGDRDGLRRLLQHRVEDQRLLGSPPPVDRGLVHLGARGDAVEADTGVAAVGQLRQRCGDHGRADPRASSAGPPGLTLALPLVASRC